VGERPWLAEGRFDDLQDLDLRSLVDGVVPESCILVSEPVFLVCTHAKRNACCARIGLPLARFLAQELHREGLTEGHAERLTEGHAEGPREGHSEVWETTHVGGDRYAANLVCLPHGLYYGSMSQAAAIAAANAYRSGKVVLDRFRGRAGLPEPSQAAEHFVRSHTGDLSVGGVAVESSRSDGDATVCIVQQGGSARFRVMVEPWMVCSSSKGPICSEECSEQISTYRLAELSPLAPVPA
jgi:hypothetical protein